MGVPSSLVMDWQTSNVYYLSNSTNVNLIGGGPSASSGETNTSAANRRGNYSANSVIQVGSKIYSWVGRTINRIDLLDISAGWSEIHSFTTTPFFDYAKSGLFNAMVGGTSYLMGMYLAASTGQIYGFRLNLETETVEVSATFVTGTQSTAYGFRNTQLFRGNLFATYGLNARVVIYDPHTNLCFQATDPECATSDARQALFVYNDNLYLVGKLTGQTWAQLWVYNIASNAFDLVQELSGNGNNAGDIGGLTGPVGSNGPNRGVNLGTGAFPNVNIVAWVTQSSTEIENAYGVTESIWMLTYGRVTWQGTPATTIDAWMLHEIFEGPGTEPFTLRDWTDLALSDKYNGETSLTNRPNTSGFQVFSNIEDSIGVEPNVWLYYTDTKDIAATRVQSGDLSLLEHIPRTGELFPPRPTLSFINDNSGMNSDDELGSWNLVNTSDGGNDKLYYDIDTNTMLKIEGIERVTDAYLIYFTLWGGTTSSFDVSFLYATDLEAPREICSLQNTSHGSFSTGTFGSIITGLTSDDGATLYSVEWDTVTDGITDLFETTRIAGRVNN